MDVGLGAPVGLVFTAAYGAIQELIGERLTYGPLLKDVHFMLDAYGPLIKQIAASNEELGLPSEKIVTMLTLHLDEGIGLLNKSYKVPKWQVYKQYKYANKLRSWNRDLERLLKVLLAQGVRDGKEALLPVKRMERPVTEIEMSRHKIDIALSGVESTSGVENISGDTRELIDQVKTSSRNVEARFKKIQDPIFYCSCVILFALLLIISVSAAGGSPGTKLFVLNIGVNSLLTNN